MMVKEKRTARVNRTLLLACKGQIVYFVLLGCIGGLRHDWGLDPERRALVRVG